MSIDENSGLRFSQEPNRDDFPENPSDYGKYRSPGGEGYAPSSMMIEDGPVLREVAGGHGYGSMAHDSHDHQGGEEFLHLRRAAQVIGQHWVIALMILIITPVSVFVIDTYHREHMYVTRMRCQINEPMPLQSMALGMPWTSASSSQQTEDIAQLIRRPEVKQQLARLVRQRADEWHKAMEDANHSLTDAQRLALAALDEMVDKDGNATSRFSELSGNYAANSLSEYEAEIVIRGPRHEAQAEVAALLVEALNNEVGLRQREEIDSLIDSLQKLWVKNTTRIEEIRKEIQAIAEEVQVDDEELSTTITKTNRFEGQKYETEIQLAELKWKLKRLEREAGWEKLRERFGIGELADIKQVMMAAHPLRGRLRELENQRSELSERVTDAHPKMQAMLQQIAAVREQLRKDGNITSTGKVPPLPTSVDEKSLQEIYDLNTKVEQVAMRLNEILRRMPDEVVAEDPQPKKKKKEKTPEEIARINELRNKQDDLMEKQSAHRTFARRVYDRLSEARLLSDQLTRERIYVPLGVPGTVLESPRVVLDIALATVLGLVIGCAAAFMSESIYNHPRTPFDLYYHFRLNYLGLVPFWPKDSSFVIDSEQPDSHIAEIYAHLRNNIRYSRPNDPQRCLLVASATQGEGKSVVSVNLAISYALEGNSVLLVDADLRRPRSHILLEDEEMPDVGAGLTEYLEGSASLDDVICETQIAGLNLLPGRGRVKNPAKLIGSDRMRNLIAWAQDNYDILIIDCPAVLPVVDATYLAPLMRGVLVVVAAEEVEIPEVRMALYRLQHVGSPLLGAVLNKVRGGLSSYYYGYRYAAGSYNDNPVYADVYRSESA